jgi:hypothetical protein
LWRKRGEGRTVVEESPVGSSASNGVVEKAVQELEGQIRVLLLGLQEHLGVKVDGRERLLSFIPEYAAYLLNRLQVWSAGRVAYERVKGKRPRILGLEFGEKVLYKKRGLPSRGLVQGKLCERWGYGIFVGKGEGVKVHHG